MESALIGLMAIAAPFGGTIGLTIMSTVFNNTLGLDDKHGDFSRSKNRATLEMSSVHDAKMGVVWAYVAIVPLMIVVSMTPFPIVMAIEQTGVVLSASCSSGM
ncbi:hypothetical protein J3458_022146 [Metarhizium acridum]|uniref:uncharacterized protein n=1 Tax=Metarhizium acridum TaxID=92637 RepID=UPI001C6C4179|nr:hypothetical protein J3458_022146 [Metarhizium acridum]